MTSGEYLAAAKAATDLNAFLFLPDEPLKPENEGSLSGKTIAIKDNIMIKDWPVTAGSKILHGHIAAYSATVVKKLRQAGATIIGKTNLDEFAMGSSTENSAYGPSKNPWDKKLVPGGSSGGSAVAVAAELCDVSLGSDTGGSIRQPAAFCGATGFKPSYGTVSRYGLIALASSLDQIGPFARSAEDVEAAFQVISGQDTNDQTTVDYHYQPQTIELKDLTIGLPKELWELEIDPEIKAASESMVEWFRQHGAKTKEISLPSLKYGLPAYYLIMPAEAMANLARFDGIRYQFSASTKTLLDRYLETRQQGFGPEPKRRVLLGTYALSVGHYDAYYQTAVKTGQLISREFAQAFEEVNLIMSATTPTLPFELGSKVNDPVAMYQSDLLTVGVNLAGLPGISLPIGTSRAGLPIGGQIIGKKFADSNVLSAAKLYQAETSWHHQKPRKG